jgi:hypothetical protein
MRILHPAPVRQEPLCRLLRNYLAPDRILV